jgi:formylmethanofuran dehydrogenase subunit B
VTAPLATIDGRAVPVQAAVERGASLLRQARRVVVTGLTDAALEAIVTACDIAECLGAAVDAADLDTASPAGPILARIGSITADHGELARADLVIAWYCQADAAWPRLPDCRRLAMGSEPIAGWDHLQFAPQSAVDAACLVQALLVDPEATLREFDPALVTACRRIAEAVAAAGTVGFLHHQGDQLGLAQWSLARLVRSLAHERPAFMVAVKPPAADRLDNVSGATAVVSWRYGAAGGIARADRQGGRFLPAECDAERLIARGEVDAVLAVGRLPTAVEAAIADRAADLVTVRLDGRGDEPPGAAGCCVHIRCCSASGTVLAADGREAEIDGLPSAIDSLQTRLAELLAKLMEPRA